MKLHEFLESTYVETNQEIQKKYGVYNHAKSLATKDILDAYRTMCKVISYVEILGRFILVKAHILKQPKTAQEVFNEANKVVPIKNESVNANPAV